MFALFPEALMTGLILPIVFAVFALFIVMSTIIIVPQGRQFTVERADAAHDST